MVTNIKTSRGVIRFNNLKTLDGETVAVYGTGSRAREVWEFQKRNNNFSIQYFIDSYSSGEFLGKQIKLHSHGTRYDVDLILIASELWFQILDTFDSFFKIAIYEFPITKLKHIFVDDHRELIYITNPKCGSSAIRALMGFDFIEDEQILSIKDIIGHEYQKFTVVRDPISRLISGFNMFFTPEGFDLYKKNRENDLSHIEYYRHAFIQPFLNLVDHADKDIGIDLFVQTYLAIPDSLMDPHFMPQVHLANLCDQVSALEHLDIFLHKLGILKEGSRKQKRANIGSQIEQTLSQKSMKIFSAKYKKDVRLHRALLGQTLDSNI